MSISLKNAPNEIVPAQSQNKSKIKLRPHVPQLIYCLNGHLKHIVDTAIRKTGMYDYDPQKASKFTENLSFEIGLTLAARHKEQQGDRFRVIALVQIMQKNEQFAYGKTGFLWDATQDHWDKYDFDCRTFHLNVSVYCVHLD